LKIAEIKKLAGKLEKSETKSCDIPKKIAKKYYFLISQKITKK